MDEDQTGTGTLGGARDHARSQAENARSQAETARGPAAADLPVGVASTDVIWDEVIEGGNYSSCRLPLGAVVRFTDTGGDGCLHLLVHNAAMISERLNVADTVKVQWQAYLGPGALLLSDMGRDLMTVVADTSQRHDCLCGGTTAAGNEARYGSGVASGPTPAARELLSLALAKHGGTRADVGPCISLFKGVRVADDGSLSFQVDPRPGTEVALRADMAVIVSAANVPHALDDRAAYTVSAVRVVAWLADPALAGMPASIDDEPERQRARENPAALLRTL